MAIGSPFHERSWSPAEPISQATPGEREGRGPGLGTPAEGALDLGLVVAAIQDGLLMVFGPDDDPIPPQVFGAAAAEQPDAAVRLVDGPAVRAERIAAVLDAQTGGRLGSDRGGEEAWIRAMLGVGPQAEMAGADDLLAEGCTLEVVAFDRELMITFPSGVTFLGADARSRTPDSVSLRVAGEGPVALADLVARLLADAGQERAEAGRNEFAAPECKAWLEGDALRIDLPGFGTVDLARAHDDAGGASSVSLFMASGALASMDDLLAALSRPMVAPSTTVCPDPLDPPLPQLGAEGQSARPVPLTLDLPDAVAAAPDRVALVVVRGLPGQARLSAGVEGGDGGWLLSPWDLAGLSLTPPSDWAADLTLEVAAIAIANPAGELTSASWTVVVPSQAAAVAPARSALPEPAPSALAAPAPSALAAPAPSAMVEPTRSAVAASVPSAVADPVPSAMVEPEPAHLAEPAHASIPLGLDPEALHLDGPFDAVIVRDLPAGLSVSPGTYDPAIAGWVLLPHELSELSVITAGGQSGAFTLCLLGVSLRPGGQARPRVLARVPVSFD